MHISDWSSDVCSSDLRDPPVTQVKHTFTRIRAEGTASVQDRAIAEEVPIAIEMGGLGYAVLMATPADLEDLAYGFTWSERLIDRSDQITFVDQHVTQDGVILRVGLSADVLPRIHDRVRHRPSESSCGLCGQLGRASVREKVCMYV